MDTTGKTASGGCFSGRAVVSPPDRGRESAVEKVESQEGTCTARVGNQLLHLSPSDGNLPFPTFVQFSPTDVILARQEVAGLSVRNQLRGKVCRIVPAHQALFIAVDIGPILWAEVTPQAAAELELQPGVEVVGLVKAHSLVAVQ